MARQKQVRLDIPGDFASSRDRAKHLVKVCKERDAKLNLVSVRIDHNTIKLMPKDKAEKKGLNFKIAQL